MDKMKKLFRKIWCSLYDLYIDITICTPLYGALLGILFAFIITIILLLLSPFDYFSISRNLQKIIEGRIR